MSNVSSATSQRERVILVVAPKAPGQRRLDLIPELPVLFFLASIAIVAVQFNDRPTLMPDQSLTFDHWWYFFDRLRHGALAEWNPYSLFGRIAVQWNYIPASLVYLPFLFAAPRIEYFPFYNAFGTFAAYLGVYLAGRIAGYGRYLPFLPIVVLATSGYRYWAAFLHFAGLLAFFPVAMAFLVRASDRDRNTTWRHFVLVALLLAISMSGQRLEKMVYAIVFASLTFAAIALSRDEKWRARILKLVLGAVVVAIAVLANAWQIDILLESIRDNARVAIGSGLGKLTDPLLLKWFVLSIAFQPALAPIILSGLFYALWRMGRIGERSAHWSVAPLLTAAGYGLVAYNHRWLQSHVTLPASDLVYVQPHFETILSWHGIAALVLANAAFAVTVRRPSLAQSSAAVIALYVGIAVSTYSWLTWPIYTQFRTFFMPTEMASFMAVGAVGLLLKGRAWILWVLLAFHVIGETLSLPMWYVAGVPWNPPRAGLVEVAFQAFMMMEAAQLLGRAAGTLLKSTLGNGARGLQSRVAAVSGVVAWTVAAVVLFEHVMLPVGIDPSTYFPPDIAFAQFGLPEDALRKWVKETDGAERLADFDIQSVGGGGDVSRSRDPREGAVVVSAGASGAVYLRHSLALSGADMVPYVSRGVRFSISARTRDSHPILLALYIQDGAAQLNIATFTVTPAWQRFTSPLLYATPESRLLTLTVNIINRDPGVGGEVQLDALSVERSAPVAASELALYAQDFPFDSMPFGRWSFRQDWMVEAAKRSKQYRPAEGESRDVWQRVKVDDSVMWLEGTRHRYSFLPAFSRSYNTAPVYASEIPDELRRIAAPPPAAMARAVTMPHPEAAPFVLVLTSEAWKRQDLKPTDYFSNLTIAPHRGVDPVMRALLAEQGTPTVRAFLGGRVVGAPDIAAEREMLRNHLQSGGKLEDLVTTSDPLYLADGGKESQGNTGTVAFRRDEPERVILDVSSAQPGYLVLLDLWSRGWSARVNGMPTAVFRAFLGTRFVPVPAGSSVVEFDYRIPGLWLYGPLSAVAWLALIAASLTAVIRARQSRSARKGQ